MNMLLQNDLQEVKEEFKVIDLQSATWVLRKLRAVNEKMNEINTIAVEEIFGKDKQVDISKENDDERE